MTTREATKEHVDAIAETLQRDNVVEAVRDHLSKEGQEWLRGRREKDQFLSEHLFSPDKIDALDEGTLRQMIRRLWAYGSWTNKDYLLDEMLKSGLSTIRSCFKHLLFSDASLEERFNRTVGEVRMMGAASVSEILCHYDKSRYAIWNRRAREGLVQLGVAEAALPASAQISGGQYESFCSLMRSILKEVQGDEDFFEDLFVLDYVLYYLSTRADERQKRERDRKREGDDFDHGEAIDDVLELGDGLGFEVERKVGIAPGARVDAVWRTRIANLGTISYAFEIHRRGSRDSAILNLQKVLHQDASIRKVVLVSTESELDRFRSEIESLEETFRRSVGYLEVSELLTALEHLDGLKELLAGLGLLDQVV